MHGTYSVITKRRRDYPERNKQELNRGDNKNKHATVILTGMKAF
jgi:hypothetical protein